MNMADQEGALAPCPNDSGASSASFHTAADDSITHADDNSVHDKTEAQNGDKTQNNDDKAETQHGVSVLSKDEVFTENVVESETHSVSTHICVSSCTHTVDNPTVTNVSDESRKELDLEQQQTSNLAPNTNSRLGMEISEERDRDLHVESNQQQNDCVNDGKITEPPQEEVMEVGPPEHANAEAEMDIEEGNKLCSNSQLKDSEMKKSLNLLSDSEHVTVEQGHEQVTEQSVSSSHSSPPLDIVPDTSENIAKALPESLVDELCVSTSLLSSIPSDMHVAASCQRESETLSVSSSHEGGGQATPSVSSSGYGGSREASPEDGGLITEDMKAEEEKLRKGDSREPSLEREVSHVCVCVYVCVMSAVP